MMPASVIRVGVHGAAGRMGRRVIALAAEDPALKIAAAFEQSGHAEIGQDAGSIAGLGPIGVHLSTPRDAEIDVVIDFSVPHGAMENIERCRQHSVGLVLGTTGLTTEQQELVRSAATAIPIVWAPSMSLAVNLAMKLTQIAAEHLSDYAPGVDVEIMERHHRFKEDAPSGTALRFGELISQRMGQQRHIHGRHGRPGQRLRDEIGYHALRTGDNPGEHTIVFGMMGETLELTVKATNRDCYALGALVAAKFVAGKPAGLYTMEDVLGL